MFHAGARVFHNERPFRNAFQREDTGGMDGGRAYDQAHDERIVNARAAFSEECSWNPTSSELNPT
jgi:hypothetical protein